MSETEDKLRRGFALIERSGGDPDLLGMALLAIHGALEAHFRTVLSARHDLTPDERHLIDDQQVSGAPLVALVRRYLGLSREALDAIQEVNALRRTLARGEALAWGAGNVLGYGRFVEAQCALGGTLDAVLIERRRTRASAAAEAADVAEAPRRGISLASLVGLALLIVLLLLGARFAYDLLTAGDPVDTIASQIGLGPPPTVTPGPTAAPPAPTARPRTARLVRLGDAIGFLHDTAAFDSATLPPRLRDGIEVLLLDQQAADTDGNQWQLVSYNGYDGWVPLNNLEILP